MAKDELVSGQYDKTSLIEAWLYVVKKMIDDKNVAVLSSALDFFNIGIKKLRPGPGHYSPMAD